MTLVLAVMSPFQTSTPLEPNPIDSPSFLIRSDDFAPEYNIN